jgi:group I intron endonuclease
MGFIYKITNIISNKCYIGETKKSNPYLRWNEHKRKITQGIGCPALQDAVKKYGVDNFKFEILIICFDEDRFTYEIDYIKKYNSMSPNGYNLTKGGEGGGFYGKKHSQQTIDNLSFVLKQKYIDNPELKQQSSERQKIVMSSMEARKKITEGLSNSEKWKLAKENKKVGNCNHRKPSEKTKNKIKESLKKYFNENSNSETKVKIAGIKISQYDNQNNLINTFSSIREASRITGIAKTSIGHALNKNTSINGIVWKKI